jgi:hypothetical protein
MGPNRIPSWAACLAAAILLGTGCRREQDDSHRPGTDSLPPKEESGQPRDDSHPPPDNGHRVPGAVHIELAAPGDTEFTTAAGENRIRLRARLPAGLEAAEVVWQIQQGIGNSWTPVQVPAGAETAIAVVVAAGTTRYQGPHPNTVQLRAEQLKRERIRYQVSAVARLGGRSVPSDTLRVEQSALAVIRQEYIDLGLRRGAPPLGWFKGRAQFPVGLNYGDFDVVVAEPEFMQRLAKLEQVWKNDYRLRWQLTSLFRNPVHNRFHVTGGGSGPVSNSWHQFGCAADLQTFPPLGGGRATPQDSVNARQFWEAMNQAALELDFQVEPRDKNPARPGAAFSGVGHIHVETDCVQ